MTKLCQILNDVDWTLGAIKNINEKYLPLGISYTSGRPFPFSREDPLVSG